MHLIVDKERQRHLIQIEQHANHTALLLLLLSSHSLVNSIHMLAIVHEPRPIRVNVHAPRLVVFAEHVLACHIVPCDAKRRIGLIIVPVHGDLPIVDALGEAQRAEHDAVLVADACGRCEIVTEENVAVRRLRIEREPKSF